MTAFASFFVALALGGAAQGMGAGAGSGAEIQRVQLPLAFEANRGQFDARVRFVTRSAGATVLLTDDEAVMLLPGRPMLGPPGRDPGDPLGALHRAATIGRGPGATLRMRVAGPRRAARIAGAQRLPGIANYYRGRDRKRWRTGVPTFRQVRYAGIYSGTDLVYYGNPQRLEYDFVLKPGADPGQIRLAFAGAERLQVAANGDLIATTPVGDVAMKRPFAYQMEGGRRVQVACAYALAPDSQGVALRVARYDATRTLVVDPALAYATFLGGSAADTAGPSHCSDQGETTIMSVTRSTDYPTTAGAPSRTAGGKDDFCISRLSADGRSLVFSTYYGGSGVEERPLMAVDAAGNTTIGGSTTSQDLPTTKDVLQPAYGGTKDALAARFRSDGSLVFSTYLGGRAVEEAMALTLDRKGCVTLVGHSRSENFPTTRGALITTGDGWEDGFVTRLDGKGRAVYSTLIGGEGGDYLLVVTGDGTGMVVAGGFSWGGWPATRRAFRRKASGAPHACLVKLSPKGEVIYATFLGGSGSDWPSCLALDSRGAAVLLGRTESPDFPVTPDALQQTFGGGISDGYIARFSPDGSMVEYASYLGGSKEDFYEGTLPSLDVGPNDDFIVAANTTSPDIRTTPNAICRSVASPGTDVVLMWFDSSCRLIYSTYFGGPGGNSPVAARFTASGSVRTAIYTSAQSLPTTPGGLRRPPTTDNDTYVLELRSDGRLVYASYLGAAGDPTPTAVFGDQKQGYTLVGWATKPTVAATPGALQPAVAGGLDVFVARIRAPAAAAGTDR